MESQAHQQQKSPTLARPLDSKLAHATAVASKSQSKNGVDLEPSSLPVSSLRSDSDSTSDSTSDHATSASTITRRVDDKPAAGKAGQTGGRNKRRTSTLLGVQAGVGFAAGSAKGAGDKGGITVGGEGGADVSGDYDGPDAEIDSGEDAIAALDAIGRADDIFLGNTKAMANAAGVLPPSKTGKDRVQGQKGVGQNLDLGSRDGINGNSSRGSSGSEVDLWTKTDMCASLHCPCYTYLMYLLAGRASSQCHRCIDAKPVSHPCPVRIL